MSPLGESSPTPTYFPSFSAAVDVYGAGVAAGAVAAPSTGGAGHVGLDLHLLRLALHPPRGNLHLARSLHLIHLLIRHRTVSNNNAVPESYRLQSSAKRRGCLLSYSQAEPGRELTQPNPCLLAQPCTYAAGACEDFPSQSFEYAC